MTSVPRPTRERAFKAAIQKIDEPLFKSRGLHIKAWGTGRENEQLKITLRIGDATENVAWLKVIIFNNNELEFLEGRTREMYRRRGYGTIIRTLACKAAKDLGFKQITQISAAVTKKNVENSLKSMEARRKLKNAGPNNNIENLKKAAAWRPVSAYIMNKLGFQINNNVNSNNVKVYTENRTLNLKNKNLRNLPTPKLNAVVRGILNAT
jgi:hypothetical protein